MNRVSGHRPNANLRWLLLAYALSNVVLYSMLLPLWEGFDEPFHFGYVQDLASGRGFPDPRTSRLSQEVGSSLLLAPASTSVQRNLPEVTSYADFFKWPDPKRRQTRQRLYEIDPALRLQPSRFVNYEGLQAPLAFAILALPERMFAKLPLPRRVLALRILAGWLGAVLLFYGAENVCIQLGLSDPYKSVAIFCALSSQMVWATLAHIANDWLAVPLTVWLLAMMLRYNEGIGSRRAVLAAVILSLGLLTKAYFLAFVPFVVTVCIVRRRWMDSGIVALIVLGLAGPWYLRNIERYNALSGMQESREGADPALALHAIRVQEWPAAIDAYARSALWTANNTFRSFSTKTLNALIVAWGAGLLLWAIYRRRRAEWIVVLYCGWFILALGYDAAIGYVYSHGVITGPSPWYAQALLVPMLALALLGSSRRPKPGSFVAGAMTLLSGYVLVCTYWVKLMPLYGGFDERTSLASITRLYAERLPVLMAALNDVCLAPASVVLILSGVVTLLALAQQFILIRALTGIPEPSLPADRRPRGASESA